MNRNRDVPNTAIPKIYRINNDANIQDLENYLEHDLRYSKASVGNNIQTIHHIKISLFTRPKNTKPDWVDLFAQYADWAERPSGFKKYDFAALFSIIRNDEVKQTFAVCAGSSIHDIAGRIDSTFGISVLERVFNPDLNKIKSIEEKGIIGDILASRRFYRKARAMAYEDDFGKYYENINTPLKDQQIRDHLQRFARQRGDRIKETISISGSSNLTLMTQINFIELLYLLNDLADLMDVTPATIFNKTLIPLTDKRDSEQITQLDDNLFQNLINHFENVPENPFDYDFCYRDLESFFGSNICRFEIQDLHKTNGQDVDAIDVDDLYDLSNPRYLFDVIRNIKNSIEYRVAQDKTLFIKDCLKSMKIHTIDDGGNETTKGFLKDYLQLELRHSGVSYFLLDKKWYRLKNNFDDSLFEKYSRRISRKVVQHQFIQPWEVGNNEDAYNRLYDNPPDSLCLHPITVGNIELFDVMIIQDETTYFMFVKDGLGANVRDLTSQAFMGARIIEEEANSEFVKLRQLYRLGVERRHINDGLLTEEAFLDKIKYKTRKYILVIRDGTGSLSNLSSGDFRSRIAKFSLVEFANAMHAYDWDFTICNGC